MFFYDGWGVNDPVSLLDYIGQSEVRMNTDFPNLELDLPLSSCTICI